MTLLFKRIKQRFSKKATDDMEHKSEREMELIIQRLNSQIESKNEQIAEMNSFIAKATDNTQELIRNFRAFCVKMLESELAYGDITSRDLESMTLSELLARAKNMLKQNQEKARGIYDTFKERLTQKNQMIQGLTDQVSQLRVMLGNAEKMFLEPYSKPEETKRTPAYLLDTDSELEKIKPAMSGTMVMDDNERMVSFEEAADKETAEVAAKGSLYVQDISEITEQMKEIHWSIFKAIVESGISEMAGARKFVTETVKDGESFIGADKANRLIKFLCTLKLFNQVKISTGIRWFMILKLTDIGTKIYTDKYKKSPAVTEYEKIVREHDNAEHGYIIKDVSQILSDTGKYRSVSMSRRGNTVKLPDGRICIPDIVCCARNNIEYYEVECGNHHQSDFNEKCDKLKCITQNIFFVAPNRETVEKRLIPQISSWIKESGRTQLQLAGITVYLTSISDLALGRWTYIFNMRDEEPIIMTSEQKESEKSNA